MIDGMGGMGYPKSCTHCYYSESYYSERCLRRYIPIVLRDFTECIILIVNDKSLHLRYDTEYEKAFLVMIFLS